MASVWVAVADEQLASQSLELCADRRLVRQVVVSVCVADIVSVTIPWHDEWIAEDRASVDIDDQTALGRPLDQVLVSLSICQTGLAFDQLI